MTTVPTLIENIPVDQVDPNPHQPRRFADDTAKVAELAESIRRHGVRQAILVRPVDSRYQLVFGERRVRACRALHFATVPAVVDMTMDDDEAFRLCMAENLQRENLDPLEEAGAYKAMQARGWTLEDIAAESGRSVRHVARRAKLAELVDEWRETVAEPDSRFKDWGPAMLEIVARFAPDRQRALLKKSANLYHVRTPKELRCQLADEYHLLDQAGWSLDDASLCPKAGACSACKRRSDVNPELFDDADFNPYKYTRAKPETDTRCLDSGCWRDKEAAHIAGKVKALKAEHPSLYAIKAYGVATPKGLPAVEYIERVEAGTKGAVPAVEVRRGEVSLVWIKPPEAKAASSKASTPAKRSAAEDLEFRRKTWVCNKIASDVRALLAAGLPAEVCTPREALKLVAGLGYEPPYEADMDGWDRYHLIGESDDREIARRLVASALDVEADRIEGSYSYMVDEYYSNARNLCVFLGLDFSSVEAEATRKIPEAEPAKAKLAKGKKRVD